MAALGNGAALGDEAGGIGPAGVAALLHWWKLAGVDTPVADAPTSWLQPPAAAATPAETRNPEAAAPARRTSAALSPPVRPDPLWDSFATLEDLVARVKADHPRAPLADGNPASGLMIMGEGPSAEDLRTGRPFTGPAGQFLDRMLAAIGIDRTSAYISLLCPRRTAPGGTPDPDEIAADLALTRAHIRLAAPRLVLLLGANPVLALTGNRTAITQVRGSWLRIDVGAGPIPALATFNPAYLLRRPEEKAHAWADLLALKHRLSQ
jgi:uracil-DNA glycosylase